LGGAHTTSALQVVVSYSDQSSTTYLGATQLSNSNGITAVTICSAPAASTIRDIDMATVLNTDSVSQTITIQLLDTSTAYKIISTTLLVGEKLTYTHGSGWQVVDNSGNLKTVVLSTSGVNSFSGGSTGLTPTSATTGVVTLGGTLAVANGGTGLTSTPANGALDIGNGSGFTRATLTAGTGISVTNAAGSITIAATNSGTVTSVTGTSPVVSSGGATPAISLAASYGDTQNPYASKTANYVLAAPNGSAGVPTFRAIVAADIPTLNQNTTGTAANITASSNATLTTLSSLSLPGSQVSGNISGNAANVTGTVAVANGGTGLTTTPVNGALDIGNGTGFTRTTLTAGTNVSITNTSGAITINSSNPGGTVTSVGLALPSIMSVSGSPVTSSGTLTGTLTTQSVNTFFAGPSSGAGATPTFRALVTADIPSLGYVTSVSGTSGNITSTGGFTPIINLASGIVAAGTTGSVTAIPVITVDTYGRVTSITTAANPQGTVTSVTGTSPVVSSGGATPAISLATAYGDTLNPYASKTANYFLGAPNGSAGAPTFRTLTTADIPALSYVTSVGATAPITSTGGLTPTIGVTAAALNKVDDTNVTMTLSGSPSTALIAATTMGLGWTGQLAVSRGGTGVALTTANFVFAGPTSGSPAAPSFRALTTTDIPSLAYVTSVSLSLPSILTVSGSPVTSSGTLTGTLTTQAVNTIFAGPSSGAGVAPTFRSLTTADIPTLNQNTTGTAANITATSNSTLTTLSALSLPGSQVSGNISGNAANVTGTVAIGNGGTGQTTASAAFNALSPITTTGDLIIGNGTNSATRLAIGSNTYVLTSNGTTATWTAPAGGGASISNDTATSTNVYPLFAAATSGTPTTIYTSNSNYLYKPSTGELSAVAHVSTNGIQINATTVSSDYTIVTGNNGLSAGPVSVNTGVTVTISTGSAWTVV
jgi:hypothetical protein